MLGRTRLHNWLDDLAAFVDYLHKPDDEPDDMGLFLDEAVRPAPEGATS
ncbi:hypothetical protein [Streptomyces sp. HUAS TT7]